VIMFLHKKYILGNELAQKLNMSISNISMFRNECLRSDDMYTVRKLGNCSFINTKSHKLPRNFKNAIAKFEFTSMHNKLPIRYVKTEYGVSEKQIINSGIVTGEIQVANKDFYTFDEDFVKKVQGHMIYMLNETETFKCMRENSILGYVKISNNKFITWY